ncbi:MAG: PEP-CTERM sorting domain-containing protein [Gemmatimonadota bacterium]|nr:PEP-CTERM sorting domain-containing protein [Gemmatimonadota bacterium]
MARINYLVPIAGLSLALVASPTFAQTVVVTPSNPHGWSDSTYYGPTASHTGTGAFAGITTTYPRSGAGSSEIRLNDAANSEADALMEFSSGGKSLSSITALQYDWYRSSTSTTDGPIMPAFALHMSDNSYLVYERAYNATGNAPVDTWTTENILNGTFWSSGNGTGVCANYGAFQSLSYFNTNCYAGAGSVTGLDIYMGYTQAGTFYGAMDNPTVGFNNATPTTWNFEPDAVTATPEPSSIALLGTGLIGLVPMVRRRRKV